MSVVLVSHDLSLVGGHSDRVAVMYGGKLVELLDSDKLGRLERHPYTHGLLSSHPSIDAPKGMHLATIPGEPPDILNRPTGCPFSPRCGNRLDVCGREMPPLVPDSGDVEHLL